MEAQIRKILYRMIVIVAAMAALGVWQWEFIWHGIEHNIFVNSGIFITIIVSIIIAFYNIKKLDNEIIAFKALQEIWNDIRQSEDQFIQDPFWRHYRCLKPGIVFYPPKIFGHVYDLVTEELARTKRFVISIETMQTLVHKIDAKLAEEKSLLTYLSGLLVFMGLIGTFMGLLKMVSSISVILGSLQAASGGGADGFGKLLTDLQQPLGGMATGFASSLFGLSGSLVVGLLGRMAHRAASTLKIEFESWLAAVVQIENAGKGEAEAAAENFEPVSDARLVAMVGSMVGDYKRATKVFDGAATMLGRLVEAQETQSHALATVGADVARMTEMQSLLIAEIRQLSTLTPALGAFGGRLQTFTRELEAEGRRTAETLEATLASLASVQNEGLKTIAFGQSQVAGAVSRLAAGLGEHESPAERDLAHQRLRDAIAGTIDNRLAELRDMVAAATARPAAEVGAAMAASSLDPVLAERMIAALERQATAPTTSPGLEQAVVDGMVALSHAIEESFVSFSRLVRPELSFDQPAGSEPQSFGIDDLGDFDLPHHAASTPSIGSEGFRAALSRQLAATAAKK